VPRTWPEEWDARRNGQGYPKCAEGRPGEDLWGVRIFAGRWADAYLHMYYAGGTSRLLQEAIARAMRVPNGRITQLPRGTWTGSGTASAVVVAWGDLTAVCTSSTGLLDSVFERSNMT